MAKGIVKSAERVMAIFEAFETERRFLNISDLVAILNFPQSSVSMLMKTLVASGHMDFDSETRTFRPSPRLAFLGHWSLGHGEIVEQIQTVMRSLSDETGETILLGAQNGIYMKYLSVVDSPNNINLKIHSGLMRLMHQTCLGRMLLTLKSDDEIGRFLRRVNAEVAEDSMKAKESDILEIVALARKQGYIHSDSLASAGAGVVGVLLPLPVHGRHLAVGVGGPAHRIDERFDDIKASLFSAVKVFEASLTPA